MPSVLRKHAKRYKEGINKKWGDLHNHDTSCKSAYYYLVTVVKIKDIMMLSGSLRGFILEIRKDFLKAKG